MCEPNTPDWCVCACGDPTCIRGVLPWEPCQNADRLMARELAHAARHAGTGQAPPPLGVAGDKPAGQSTGQPAETGAFRG